MKKKDKDKLLFYIKIIFEWLIIFFASVLIPTKKLEFWDIFLIATIGSIACGFLNIYSSELANNVMKATGISLGIKTMINY